MPDKNSIHGLGYSIGEFAVKHGLIDAKDFEKAVKACADLENSDKALPEYLMAQGLFSQQTCDKLVIVAKTRLTRHLDIKFGNIAIRKGHITPSIMKLALEEQTELFKSQKKYTLLGDILVEAGMLTPQQCDTILTEQNRNHFDDCTSPDSASDSHHYDDFKNSSKKNEALSRGAGERPPPQPPLKNFAHSEIFKSGIKLIVQQDGNAAFLFKTPEFDRDISIGEIKELLESRNILHGVVENKLIALFIESDIFYKKVFKIASGNAPEPSKNASIKYFFTQNRLKAGTIREDGTIDFRERGDIPQVEKGTVLAIKKNAFEGKVGKNIFNDIVRVLPARDVRLKSGKGTRLSEESLRVITTVSGHPKLARDGTIHVYGSFVVQGDVDYETGNIDYQGDVIIKGCIQNGFTVKGNNIKAEEMDGGIVIADKNVTIGQGINESRISAGGSLSAKFIQNSTINCLGDAAIKKELVESSIECSGTCTIKGVVIYSQIAAKMGVYARQIGMQKAPPCTIRVGIDTFAKKDEEAIEHTLEREKIKEKEFKEAITEAQKKMEAAKAKILRISAIEEIHDKERMELISIISTMDNSTGKNKENLEHMQEELKQLIKNGEEINQTISICRNTISDMKKRIAETKQMIQKNHEVLTELLNERNNLLQWMKTNPGFAMIKVEGEVMAGTRVYGKHSEDTIKSNVKAVVIKEDQISRFSKENETGSWKMHMTKI